MDEIKPKLAECSQQVKTEALLGSLPCIGTPWIPGRMKERLWAPMFNAIRPVTTATWHCLSLTVTGHCGQFPCYFWLIYLFLSPSECPRTTAFVHLIAGALELPRKLPTFTSKSGQRYPKLLTARTSLLSSHSHFLPLNVVVQTRPFEGLLRN